MSKRSCSIFTAPNFFMLLAGIWLVEGGDRVEPPRRPRERPWAHILGDYLVDTRFTDFFGRNATCAANSIFVQRSRHRQPTDERR